MLSYNSPSIWIKDEVGTFMREDVQDAIKGVLGRAAKGGCPKCAEKQ